ncbi:hypothetical protein SAMN06265348_104106 [Pedobacter westerhofensis]|uniref:Uncharacterized protein n=1 Tax=Pedobacter westerhofensis TaxID=425512 RepID=A0A521CSE7_9SPHI|nr:hypothetical protein SAMN06265348_104106 [Pedobacter westerhofensis]
MMKPEGLDCILSITPIDGKPCISELPVLHPGHDYIISIGGI